MADCPVFDASSYAPSLLATIDCNAGQLDQLAFGALSAPNSPAVLMIAGMLNLLVALIGYRLILGERFELSNVVITVVKIGLVLALATQWPAYRTLFYDVATKGPQEILAQIHFGDAEKIDDVPRRLQASYDRLATIEMPPTIATGTRGGLPNADPYAAAQLPTPAEITYGNILSFRPMSAGLLLLFSGVVALALPRIIAGLMLALGPIFIGFLLFDATRSIFLGWLRTLGWSVVASLLATMMLSIEFSIVEPQITELAARLARGGYDLDAMGELVATSLLFALMLMGAMVAALAPTRLRMPSLNRSPIAPNVAQRPEPRASNNPIHRSPPDPSRSRAQDISDRLVAGSRYYSRVQESVAPSTGVERRIDRTTSRALPDNPQPLGQSYRSPNTSRRATGPAKRKKPA